MEWSLYIHTKLTIQFTLLWFCWHRVNISDSPSLSSSTSLGVNNNVSVFRIYITLNFEDLSMIILDVSTSQSPELEPSRVSSVEMHVL